MTLNQPAPAGLSNAVYLWRRATAARYGECPTCTALLYPMAAGAFAALGDRADATVFAQAAERVAHTFQS
jgi:hypothetical protein